MTARERILDATERLMSRAGASSATMGRIVEESGVSKSGLIHHFRSKRQILDALAQRTMRRFEDVLKMADSPEDRRARTRAYARCLFAGDDALWPMHRIAALLDEKDLLDPMVGGHRRFDSLESCLAPEEWVDTVLTRMALEGLWWSDMIDPQRMPAEQHHQLITFLAGEISESQD